MSTQTVPYSHKRGSVHDDVTYLTDATDRGVSWIEGVGENQSLITLRNTENSWFFTEVKGKLTGMASPVGNCARVFAAIITTNSLTLNTKCGTPLAGKKNTLWALRARLRGQSTPLRSFATLTQNCFAARLT